MTNFVNLTPHPINLVNLRGADDFTVQPSGFTLMVPMESREFGLVGPVPLRKSVVSGSVTIVPLNRGENPMELEELISALTDEDTVVIVSRFAAEGLANAGGFVAIADNSGGTETWVNIPVNATVTFPTDTVRDEQGKITGCQALEVL